MFLRLIVVLSALLCLLGVPVQSYGQGQTLQEMWKIVRQEPYNESVCGHYRRFTLAENLLQTIRSNSDKLSELSITDEEVYQTARTVASRFIHELAKFAETRRSEGFVCGTVSQNLHLPTAQQIQDYHRVVAKKYELPDLKGNLSQVATIGR